jgi:hypothetical protein
MNDESEQPFIVHRSSFIVRKEVSMRRITNGLAAWLLVITAAHMALNVNWSVLVNDRLPESKRKLNVAYIPVT